MGSGELSCGGESLQNPLPLPCPSASCLTNRTSCKRRQKVACEPRGVAVHPHFLLEVGINPPHNTTALWKDLSRANRVPPQNGERLVARILAVP